MNSNFFQHANNNANGAVPVGNSNSMAIDAQPINISFSRSNSIYQNPKLRRESIAHSQGMGGISWGSVGIGSWLREEVMLQNNPIRHQSINLHNGNFLNNNAMDGRLNSVMSTSPMNNNSYLADLEANYCKDYSCCGQILPTLHDLLRHYEEMHIQSDVPNDISMSENSKNRNLNGIDTVVSTNEVFLNPNINLHVDNNLNFNMNGNNNNPNDNIVHESLSQFSFDQSNGGDSTNNPGNNSNNNNLHNNNNKNNNDTSNINIQQQRHNQQQQRQNNLQRSQNHQQQQHQPQMFQTQMYNTNPAQASNQDTQFQMDDEDEDEDMDIDSEICIDDPARRLYVIEQSNDRPFTCPVVGCEKTYKNQNGLKYHRIHGHQNQKLRENKDGTFSVINPDSDKPYPDGMGLEKDKPYRCEVCGKRYKNLNGLKYHRGHTTH